MTDEVRVRPSARQKTAKCPTKCGFSKTIYIKTNIYIYVVLFESCAGLYPCVESSSIKFRSEVESFLSGLRVGYICDFVLDSRSVL